MVLVPDSEGGVHHESRRSKEDLDALKAEEQADAVEEKEEKFMEEEMKEAGIK